MTGCLAECIGFGVNLSCAPVLYTQAVGCSAPSDCGVGNIFSDSAFCTLQFASVLALPWHLF
jgi:hypothetical protein